MISRNEDRTARSAKQFLYSWNQITSKHRAGTPARRARTPLLPVCHLVAFVLMLAPVASGEELIPLRNGLTLRGTHVDVATLDLSAFNTGPGGPVPSRPIWMVGDGLRRIYIHRAGMVQQEPVSVADLSQTIEFAISTPSGNTSIQDLSRVGRASPFNEYGRRRIEVTDEKGKVILIHQGIESINARYAVVKALRAPPNYAWDMRLSTSMLDTPTLNRIFRKRIDQTNVQARTDVVNFFIECERYSAAHAEITRIINDFPEELGLESQLIAMTESQFKQLQDEAITRATIGQPEFALQVLKRFPLPELGRVTRIEVQDAIADIQKPQIDGKRIIEKLRAMNGQQPPGAQQEVGMILDEIEANVSGATIARLSDIARFIDSETVPDGNKLSLAVAGWILGSGSGEQNLKIAISLIEVRALVRQYIGMANEQQRQEILDRLSTLEGAIPEYVARMLPLMTPQLPFPDGAADPVIQGMYRVGYDENGQPRRDGTPSYSIQLPPEYDPHRSYPCIVAMHPTRGTADGQIDWWSGPARQNSPGETDEAVTADRAGQAMRNGFIVVAPNWTRPNQQYYEYTGREHNQIMTAMRDAMRRSSIDADRIYITGHGEGANAAWDLSLSHPTPWAGVLTISAEPRKTIRFYAKTGNNGADVPAYFVMGEKDGHPLKRNGAIFEEYMRNKHDAMVVMYQGRGRELFYEDQPNMFKWMNLSSHRRRPTPREFDAATMRETDRSFWWLTLDEVQPNIVVNPLLWDHIPRKVAADVNAAVGDDNRVRVIKIPSERCRVWLHPEMGLDMGAPINVQYRSHRETVEFDGKLNVMLEDVRTRADRKRPFWAKIDMPQFN